jgi:hypothetical protein
LHRWKGYEGSLAQIGGVAEDLLDYDDEERSSGRTPAFNIGQVFESTVLPFLGATDLPFLQGRTFVFASQFARSLPSELADHYVASALEVLQSSQSSVPVKISAVRAIRK